MPLTLSLGTKARLSENGRPIVELIGAQLLGRDDLRGSCCSTWATIFSVSSSRDAAGARTCSLRMPDVRGREEVGADHRRQRRSRHDQQPRSSRARMRAAQRRLEQHCHRHPARGRSRDRRRRKAAPQPVDGLPCVVVPEQVARQAPGRRERQHVGRQHRQHDGDGERNEQEARRPGQQQHREEHDADRQRRHRQRLDHLERTIEDGDRQRLAQRLVAVDVLDRHRGVVDQQADGERQPAERHQVDGLSGEEQAGKAGGDRQRDRQRHDHRVPPAAEEQQDHQRHQHGREDRLVHDVVDRAAHEHRLVEIELAARAPPAPRPGSPAGGRAPPRPPARSRRRNSSGCSCSSRAGR